MSFQMQILKMSVSIYTFWNNIITFTFEILIANMLIFFVFYQVFTIKHILSVQ